MISCTTPFTPDAPAFGMHAACNLTNAAHCVLGTALLVSINLMMRINLIPDLGIGNHFDTEQLSYKNQIDTCKLYEPAKNKKLKQK